MRIFTAIEIPGEIKKDICKLQNDLRDTGADVRWVGPESMHLTLKFLGEIPAAQTSLIKEAMAAAVQDYKPFLLHIKGTGTFPIHSKHPRIIWVDIQRNDTLQSLQKALDKNLEKLGFHREKRKFHPHLTLGRVKSGRGRKELIDVLASYNNFILPELDVKNISLIESILKREGAEYRRIVSCKL